MGWRSHQGLRAPSMGARHLALRRNQRIVIGLVGLGSMTTTGLLSLSTTIWRSSTKSTFSVVQNGNQSTRNRHPEANSASLAHLSTNADATGGLQLRDPLVRSLFGSMRHGRNRSDLPMVAAIPASWPGIMARHYGWRRKRPKRLARGAVTHICRLECGLDDERPQVARTSTWLASDDGRSAPVTARTYRRSQDGLAVTVLLDTARTQCRPIRGVRRSADAQSRRRHQEIR